MSVLYAVLGLVCGIAIAEAAHRKIGADDRGAVKPGANPRSTYARRSTQAEPRSCRFAAQDFYDR